MRRRGVAVVGCSGFMSQAVYLPLLSRHPGVDLVAAVDVDPDTGREVGRRYGFLHYYDALERALEDRKVESVLVLTPPWTHDEIVGASLRSGKDVFVEKPLALSERGARSLRRLASKAGVRLCVCYMKRHDTAVMRAIRLAADGQGGLGVLKCADVSVIVGDWGKEALIAGLSYRPPAANPPRGLGVPSWVGAPFRGLYFRLASQFIHDINLLRALTAWPSDVAPTVVSLDLKLDPFQLTTTLELKAACLHLRLSAPGAMVPWRERFSMGFEGGELAIELPPPLSRLERGLLRLRVGSEEEVYLGLTATETFARQLEEFLDGDGGACSESIEACDDLALVGHLTMRLMSNEAARPTRLGVAQPGSVVIKATYPE